MQKIIHQGVTFYILYRPSSPALYAQLTVAGGSRDETADNWGHTHLLEHLISTDIVEQFAEHPWLVSSIAESLEAEVGIENTTYTWTIPDGGVSSIGAVLSAIYGFDHFDGKRLQVELGAVTKELQDHLVDPYMEHIQKFRDEIYGGSSSLARATAVGSKASLRLAMPARLRQLHHTLYQPENTTVYLVGDVKARDIAKLDFSNGTGGQSNASATPRTLLVPLKAVSNGRANMGPRPNASVSKTHEGIEKTTRPSTSSVLYHLLINQGGGKIQARI